MINKIGKITIYVNNQEDAKEFWIKKLGFVIKEEHLLGNTTWLEVAINKDEFTTFILYDKELMKQQNPTASVEHPSIILSTLNIEEAYNKMKEKNIEVGDLLQMPYGKMFIFKDQDNNSYILREDKE